MQDEEILLSQILQDNNLFHLMDLSEHDFTTLETRRIYKAIHKCILQDMKADILTVYDIDNKIKSSYLASLTSLSTANWKHYYQKVKNKTLKRQLEKIQVSLTDWLKETPGEALQKLEKAITDIQVKSGKGEITHISDEVQITIDTVEKNYKLKGKLPGIGSGLSGLDDMTLGFRDKMMYVIGARPSQGKSALLMNMALHAAVHEKTKVGYLSTESSTQETMIRMYAATGNMDSMNLASGILSQSYFKKIGDVTETLRKSNIYFYYAPGMTLEDLISHGRQMVRVHGCKILFIDYLQDITVEDGKELFEQTRRKSKALKVLAESLTVPVVVAAQLRRDSDNRRPRLSDFSDSSQIEKDADGAILIYHQKENGAIIDSWLLVEKSRDGKTGDIPIYFKKEYVKFTEKINEK